LTVESFPAPAKLNLMLRVVGRRPDGYHLLQTVFRLIDHADEVRLAIRGDGVIRRVRQTPGVAEDDDLAVRAARLLKSASGTVRGADIEIVKRLPPGGGLGGGSSDAATTMIALNRLWNTGLEREELQSLAAELGADVPFFIFGESAFGEGIGELLRPIALPPAWYVVLTPPIEVSTARIFAHPDLKRDSKPIKMQAFSAGGSPTCAANDLESLVCRLYPEVACHLDWLRRQGPALMTGSGASVFCAFGNEREARAVFARRPAGMRGFVAAGLDRHPLHELVS
jgi:4-diphosphocytidyl-2-C-methyl-D-erythritol kinase